MYEYLGYPIKLICPISFLWKPKTQDTLWIWIHPSAFNEALLYIKKALQETKATQVELSDLRDDILRFELTGPRSTALLQAILDPVHDVSIRGNQVWQDLNSLRSSCSLSPGAVLGLVVQDPRLKFPQKVPPRTNEISKEDQKKVQALLDQWPLDASDTFIWDKEQRQHLFDNKISEYQLNLRRENNLVPGSKLKLKATDSKIPLLLIQRGGPMYNTVAQKPLGNYEFVEGWTLILPRGFGLHFWKSLVFAGARVAGYNDVRAMHFESGFPCFPQDYPGTRAFEVQRQMDKKAAEEVWEKRPPAKRVNFTKRGIDYPFECAFETLVSHQDPMEDGSEHNLASRPTYALLHGDPLLSSVFHDNYSEKLNTLVAQRGLESIWPSTNIQLDNMLVKIRVKYIGRGKPSPNALIYVLEDSDEYFQCIKHTQQRVPGLKGKRKVEDIEEEKLKTKFKIPEKSQQIGYVTNGNFSLTLGFGFGVGACTASGLKKLHCIDRQ